MITAPGPRDRIRSPLEIEGTAAPGQTVEVTVAFQPSSPESASVAAPPISTVTGRNGKCEVKLNLQAPRTAGRITITAVALGPGGARSEPTRVVLPWAPPRESDRQ